MSDVSLNFLFLIFSIALAVFGAVVGARLQHRSWLHQNWEKLRSDRKAAALAAVERAAELIDKRLYRQRRFLWAVRGGNKEEFEIERQEYRAAISEWMGNLGRIKAEFWTSFDRDTAIIFEEKIHDVFMRNGKIIELAYRTGDYTNLPRTEHSLDELGFYSYRFVQNLLDDVQRENITGLRNRYEISYRNWENLSASYLLARLFGVAPSR